MQYEIKIYSPVKPGLYVVDVYVDGKREFCGSGWNTAVQAARQATDWIEQECRVLQILELIAL